MTDEQFLLVFLYIFGGIGTLAYNLHDMVYITRPLAILRNAIFWPIFLPVLIAIKNSR